MLRYLKKFIEIWMGGGSLNLEILRGGGGGAGLKQSWKYGWKGRGGGKKCLLSRERGGCGFFLE